LRCPKFSEISGENDVKCRRTVGLFVTVSVRPRDDLERAAAARDDDVRRRSRA
jgi:hypothetical protein